MESPIREKEWLSHEGQEKEKRARLLDAGGGERDQCEWHGGLEKEGFLRSGIARDRKLGGTVPPIRKKTAERGSCGVTDETSGKVSNRVGKRADERGGQKKGTALEKGTQEGEGAVKVCHKKNRAGG